MGTSADISAAIGSSWKFSARVAGFFALSALAMAAAVAADGTASAAASAASAAPSFDLPEDALIATLRFIAERTGTEIRFDAGYLRGMQSRAVRGTHDAQSAVRTAIQGLPLILRPSTTGGWQVEPATALQVTVVAKRDEGEVSFKADRSATSTRSDAALLDIPSSVTVITSKALQSQMSTSIRDALANVSGVTFSQSPQGRDSYQIRGYSSTSLTTNGLGDSYAAGIGVASVERIEVLKGPQAILAGSDALGGGVNVVTKRPQVEQVQAFSLQYGSRGDALVTADLSGTLLSDDARLTYRFTGSREGAGKTESGFRGLGATSLMPQLRWKDGGTDLTVGASYDRSHRPTPDYTVLGADGHLLPRPAQRIGTEGDGFEHQSRRFFYDLRQQLTTDITLVSRAQRGNGFQKAHLYALTESLAADGSSKVYSTLNPSASATTSGDHYLQFALGTGPIDHKLSLGFAHTSSHSTSAQWDNYDHYFPVSLYPSVDPGYADPWAGAAVSYTSSLINRERGYYLQDLMSWGDWNLMVNVRRSHFDQRGVYDYGDTTMPADPLVRNVTTPAVGAVYKVSDDTSVYASVAKGFSPQSGLTCSGSAVPPLTSKNQELGVKWDLMDNRLSVTTALFSLQQSSVLQYDLAGNCYTTTDGLKTQGVEADVQGQVLPGWNLMANYSYNHSNNPANPTDLFAGLSKHKFNAWSVHELPVIAGLKGGIGLTALSSTEGSSLASSRFTIPASVRVDASLMYQFSGWDLQLMARNLTNRKNYTASGSDTYVPIGTGRSVAVRVSRNFQ